MELGLEGAAVPVGETRASQVHARALMKAKPTSSEIQWLFFLLVWIVFLY